jgi:hypothetical protein
MVQNEFNAILARLAVHTNSTLSRSTLNKLSQNPLAAITKEKRYYEISQWFLYLLDHNSHRTQHGLILPTRDTFEMLIGSMIDW